MGYDKVQEGKVGMKVMPAPEPTDISARKAKIVRDFEEALDQILTNPRVAYAVLGDQEILITALRWPKGAQQPQH